MSHNLMYYTTTTTGKLVKAQGKGNQNLAYKKNTLFQYNFMVIHMYIVTSLPSTKN